VSWRGLWGQRSDIAYAHGGIHDQHYTGAVIDGAILHGPTLAEPELVGPREEIDIDDAAPLPPPRPDAAKSKSTTPTRSALKKIDGQPAVYYNRPTR
jgi:hypothetical protein